MPRKKKLDVKVTQSDWDRAMVPCYALAVSATLVNVGRCGEPTEATLNQLREAIRFDIENKLRLEVDKISLVLVEENPPTVI